MTKTLLWIVELKIPIFIEKSPEKLSFKFFSLLKRSFTFSGSAGLPAYGELLNDISDGTMVDCEEFLNAGIKYKHSALTESPNRDEIPLVVELLDEDGDLVKQEYFQVGC